MPSLQVSQHTVSDIVQIAAELAYKSRAELSYSTQDRSEWNQVIKEATDANGADDNDNAISRMEIGKARRVIGSFLQSAPTQASNESGPSTHATYELRGLKAKSLLSKAFIRLFTSVQ